ncbi:hypothetical protein D3C72_2349890 [compost metagenome]
MHCRAILCFCGCLPDQVAVTLIRSRLGVSLYLVVFSIGDHGPYHVRHATDSNAHFFTGLIEDISEVPREDFPKRVKNRLYG